MGDGGGERQREEGKEREIMYRVRRGNPER